MSAKLKFNVVHTRHTGVKGTDGKEILVYTKCGVILENEDGSLMQIMNYAPIGVTGPIIYNFYTPKVKEPAN
jgi:hypothetical protein